ncbi:DHA2 family efflux MFS transporter permease subunit [Acidicapsa acidisoli]|uniref:DHA2 family efflux MFS transporter permease subunit n=1 Tax=Acidicapsa acidisoli TaxID=1615681 RepID=UPI0021E0BB35|nr:DHA2 family efflux MFS transporter permease subunit [Acidicapsa acidisoli]
MSAATQTSPISMQAPAKAPTTVWKPRANRWAVALTVTLATFMEVLDTSIANVALPHIAGGLGASADEATWVLTSYLVANAVILPMSAYLTTFMGRKRFYMICVLLFGISSAMCGLAPSLPLLIFFRVLQGAGGGGLAPSEQAILADTFEPKDRGKAFAIYGIAVVCAPAIGPTLGGYITDNFDWRWIFFINIPVAIISLFLTNRIVEDPPHIVNEVKEMQKKGLNLDFTGFFLLAIGFGSLEFVLDKGQEDDWFGSQIITTFSVLCISSLILLVLWEMRQIRIGHKPILDLTLFKRRNFAIAFLLMFVLGFCLFGSTVLIPQFVQSMLGYTAERAGLVISPGGFGIILLMPLVGFLVAKVDARFLVAYGFFSCSVALFVMLTLDLDVSYGYVAWLRVFQASGLAFLFVPISTISFAGMPPGKNNDVSGLTNLARNIGGSVGTAFLVTVLARRAQYHQHRLGDHLTASTLSMQDQMALMSRYLHDKGGMVYSMALGRGMAQGTLMRQLILHSTMLAYLDVIKCFATAMGLMVPIVFFMTKVKGGRGGGGH